ncbi:MAG TPA: hypothetical protein VFI31_10700 [Pirellulales bacterium]|nr:hypothetical protein [Pirellulales bacterium]
MEFSNVDYAGGFAARYADTGEDYPSHECFIGGVRCRADEARFGGIVIEAVAERNAIQRLLEAAKTEYAELGAWPAFKSGEWLWRLIQRSYRNYWERATVEYFTEKYGTTDQDKIAGKLIEVAAKNAAILGGLTGAAVSIDEMAAILTAAGGGVGLPANLAIGGTAISAEAILLLRFQIQLVANLGKLYGVPLDPDDPEDILVILAFALGGGAAGAAGKAGAKVGGKIGGRAAKAVFSKDLLALLKKLAAKIGVKDPPEDDREVRDPNRVNRYRNGMELRRDEGCRQDRRQALQTETSRSQWMSPRPNDRAMKRYQAKSDSDLGIGAGQILLIGKGKSGRLPRAEPSGERL